jgi:ATP-dependent Lon protease
MAPKQKNDKSGKGGFQPRKKKSGGGNRPDDDSVDSKGNIRGLIDYEYTSGDESFLPETEASSSSKSSPIARRTRNSLVKTKAPKKKSKKTSSPKQRQEETDSSDEEVLNKLRTDKKRLLAKLKKEEEEDERLERMERAYEEKLAAKSRRRRHRRVVESESEEEEEESEEEESEDYEDDSQEEDEEDVSDEDESEEDSDEDSEESSKASRPGAFVLSFGGGFDDGADRMIPKRHNMKKESKEVKKFVKLITTQPEEDTIDGQIDQFKALPEDKRTKLLDVLEARNKPGGPSSTNSQQGLMFKILTMNVPTEVQSMVLSKYNSLQNQDPGSSEYFKHRNWLEKLTSLPLGFYKELPVKLSDGSETCGAFMERARRCLDEAIYGQDEAKLQVLQFIGAKIANPQGRGLSLLLAGPPGIGKTSLIKNGIAKALDWPFQFISLGGDSDASTYTGHQLVYEGSHCGKIVNSLVAAKSMSMVLMFDELDKISTTPKGEEVQNLLVHLTDPVQNADFEDKYLAGVPIDLSRVMFTFSANDLGKVDRVLMDRMIVIHLEGYSQKEKVAIAENYLLPAALKEVGLSEKVGIGKDVVEHILKEYAHEESGVRELKRCMEQIAQKINMLRMFNTKELPFHIKDFTLPFVVKKEHVDLFLKKKQPQIDVSAQRMYC